jgi:hypothetical protein
MQSGWPYDWRKFGIGAVGLLQVMEQEVAKLNSMLADAKAEISAQRRMMESVAKPLAAKTAEAAAFALQLKALQDENDKLASKLESLQSLKANEISALPKEDQAVQTDAPSAAPVSKEEQLAFQQLRPVLGLEIAKEPTQGKGLHIIMVKANGPAAAAGLLEDEYLHVIQDGEEGMVPLTSSAVFEKIVKSTVPGDTLKAEVYASLPSDDLAGSHDAMIRTSMCRWSDHSHNFRHVDITIGASGKSMEEIMELRKRIAEGGARVEVAWQKQTHVHRRSSLPNGKSTTARASAT